MVQVLVIGAKGQVGQEVFKAGPVSGLTLHGLARDALDVTDRDAVLGVIDTLEPRLVINAAAYTAVDKAEGDFALAYAVNREAPGYLAEACARHTCPLLHISTDYVFDGTKTAAYVESDPVSPLGVYGLSKEAGEARIRAVLPQHVILRTAWVFGAAGRNFVKTMLRLAETRDELTVVADQKGGPTAAVDIAAALIEIARQVLDEGRDDTWGTYHFAGQPATTWYDFAVEIFAQRETLTGHPAPRVKAITTENYPTPAQRPSNSVLDGTKVAAVFGIDPPDWRVSLNRVLKEVLS